MLVRGGIALLILVALAGALSWVWLTPHDRYGLTLKLSRPDAAARWNESASASLREARPVVLPLIDDAVLDGDAVAYEFHVRRGQRYLAKVRGGRRVFVDLFRRENGDLTRVSSAPADSAELGVDIPADGDYLVRVQPALDLADLKGARVSAGSSEAVVVSQTIQPSLAMPVEGAKRSSIQSGFGAARDAGGRQHQGVDIVAPRGTPVLAAADGIVTSVGINGLGGNVVWQVRPLRRESLYYAHLDTQLAKAGSYVRRGDILGTVGNTGNARGGPAHLHFGIYAPGGAVDPLPYLAAVAPPAGRASSVRSHGETSPRKSPARREPGANSAPVD